MAGAEEGPQDQGAGRRLWRGRDYRAWFIGDTFSQAGLFIGIFAFSLLAFHVTGDTATAGLVGAVSALSQGLSTLPGGYLADRVDRRRLLILAGLSASIVYGALAVLAFMDLLSTVSLLVFAAVGGLVGGIFATITDVVLPQIVTKDLLPSASAANQSRDAAIQLGASPLSGLLFGLAPALPFFVTSILRLGQAGAGAALRADLRPQPGEGSSPDDVALSAGLRWLVRWAQPRTLILLVLGVNFALGATGMAILLNQQQIGTPPWQIGLIQTVQGVGVLLGGLALGALTRTLTGGRIIRLSLIIIGIAFLAVSLTQNVWATAALALLASLPLIPLNAMQGSFVALLIPDRIRGRVLSIEGLATSVAGAIGPAVAGLLLKHGGYVVAILVPVGVFVVLLLVSLVSRAVSSVPMQGEFDRIQPLE
ncbi:MFS transporter [Isoptericola sp. NPDC057191]|uniref:MFS transporter n=1 Tax=Isoptericola sp. NPDC057191 TaxID=3346041 RepID=UPI00362F2992